MAANQNKPYLEQPALHTKAPHRAALLTYPGNFRKALQVAKADKRKTLLGVAHGIPSVFVTKILASARPDFIWIDVEHGIFDRSTLFDAIHAAQHHSEGQSMVVCRVPKHDEISITTSLDAGAAGLVIPHTETVADIDHMVKMSFYGPKGERSFSPWTFTPGVSDASLYANDAFNVATSNNHICLIAQIESVKGLENIEAIASHPHVDGLMFGPGDFSIDAGIDLKLGEDLPPRLMEAMGKFVSTAHKYGKPMFGGAQAANQVPVMIQSGYAAVAVTFDYWGLAGMVSNALKDARASCANMVDEPQAEPTTNGEKTKVAEHANGAVTEVVNGQAKA